MNKVYKSKWSQKLRVPGVHSAEVSADPKYAAEVLADMRTDRTYQARKIARILRRGVYLMHESTPPKYFWGTSRLDYTKDRKGKAWKYFLVNTAKRPVAWVLVDLCNGNQGTSWYFWVFKTKTAALIHKLAQESNPLHADLSDPIPVARRIRL